ncbi:hypothetical protein IDH28_01670 [Pelagibacterales bacterium SAG-MED31]|nr:hypothetical protein [Pelagibacterales bacterium SAG-MED31]
MKKNNVKKEDKIETQFYSKQDLNQLSSIVNFNNLIFNSVKSETKANLVTVKYSQSDKEKFQNIIDNKYEKLEYVSNKNDQIEIIKKSKKMMQFTLGDEKMFEKLNNFSLYVSSNYDLYKKENKKVISDSVNYSAKDISAFNRILNNKKSNKDNIKKQKELSSKFNKSSMKIIDYDKTENRATNFDIGSNNNIKIKYFD